MSVWYQMGQAVRNVLTTLSNKAILDTESNIQARTGDELGAMAFATDTSKLYVYTSSGWVHAQ
jgi:hypothetical protein